MTSCFVYKVMGLTFHNRINTQLISRFGLAQVVTITKPQQFFKVRISLAALFFIQFFLFFGGFGECDFIILFISFFHFIFFFIIF